MKKVLSVLLAVCLFATLLVPAFAAIPTYGKLADVAKVEFDKTEYKLADITKDGNQVDVTALLTCWDSNGNRTNFNGSGLTASEIRAYWTSNDAVLAIDESTGRIDKIKNNLSTDQRIQLRVTMASGKQATTTIVVPANKPEASKEAYGFRVKNIEFEQGHYLNGAAAVDKATLTWTATALKDVTVNILGTAVAINGTKTAAEVATLVKESAAGTYAKNGVTYTAAVDGAVVTWTADLSGNIEDSKPADSDLTVTVGTTTAAGTGFAAGATGVVATAEVYTTGAVTYTADADSVVTIKYKLNNGTEQTATATVTGDADAATTATAIINALKAVPALADAFDIAGSNTGITFTAKALGLNKASVTGVTSGTTTSFDITAGSAVPGVDEVKKTVEFTAFALNGANKITIGGKTISLTETSYTPAGLAAAIAASTETFEFNGTEYVATSVDPLDTSVVIFTEKGAATAGAETVTGETVSYGVAAANVKFNNASAAGAGNPVVYNVGDEITPILSSYAFTADQKNNFKFAVRTANNQNSHKITVGFDSPSYAYGLAFQMGYDENGVPALFIGEDTTKNYSDYAGTYVYVRVLNDKFANAQTEKEFSIKLVGTPGTTEKVLPAEAYVGVGQTLDLTTLSKSVDGVKTYWSVDTYGNYQNEQTAGMIAKIIMETVDDDGDAYGWTVKGLAPGVVTIKLRDAKNGAAVDTMKLNVGAGSPATPAPSTASATVKVNEQVKLSVKNLNSDEYVKWSIDNNNVSLANYDGAAATVYGKKEGTAVVTAKVYESKAAANDGKDPVNTFKINVTVKAAESKPVTTPDTTAPTTNPQTGDSIFANLF